MDDLPSRPDWDDRDSHDSDVKYLVVESNGGKYDDRSFIAGIQFGQVRMLLYDRKIRATTTLVYSDLVHQLDLLAMAHGYTCDVLIDDGIWAQVGFSRIEKD